ncbi:UNVERIFIED_CONTAM: hypothetical protein Scaly_0594500 [Sesamum calycinum]|uniref:Reverse transcriptase RNase H-like domain-containing protein n=1 Tax=Sesamum calycinum TaxID=2727403 RepID=A0AAW2RSA1_9LAMI
MVIERGLEANLEKVEVVLKMLMRKSVKDIQKLAGIMASLSRFISKPADKASNFYVSGMLQGVEKNYLLIEKYALALIVTIRKLRPVFQSHEIILLTDQPLKQDLMRLDASGMLVKWVIELGEFHNEFQPRSAIKAQVLTDFLVEMSSQEGGKDQGKWLLQVDGFPNSTQEGTRIVLTPQRF